MSTKTFILLFCILWLVLYWTDSPAGGFVEAGAGVNGNLTGCSICWESNDSLGAYFRAGYETKMSNRFTTGSNRFTVGVHWVHLSQWFEGPPFNHEAESSADHIGVYIRYDF